jgi:hypothetical protein
VSSFTNVTCVPRGTVMFCGQTALFAIVIVVEVVGAVHAPGGDGDVVLFELPPHAHTAATIPAASAQRATDGP